MTVITNKAEYLRERGNPLDKLSSAHKQIQEEKIKGTNDALRMLYNESERYQAKLAKWHEEKDGYQALNLPMSHILKMNRKFEAEVEQDFIAFVAERTGG